MACMTGATVFCEDPKDNPDLCKLSSYNGWMSMYTYSKETYKPLEPHDQGGDRTKHQLGPSDSFNSWVDCGILPRV